MNNIRKKIIEEGHTIPLSYDFMFAEVFNNPDNISILEYFIADYLDIPIISVKGNLKILSRDLRLHNKTNKNKQVDVLLDLGNEKINIEMNNSLTNTRSERNVVYIANVHGENLKYKENYNSITRTLQINFNNFSCNKDKIIESYFLRNERGEILTKNFQIDYVDMTKAKNICYNDRNQKEMSIKNWCLMILTDKKDEIDLLGGKLMPKEEKEKLEKNIEDLSTDDEMVHFYTKYDRLTMEKNTFMDDVQKHNESVKEFNKEKDKFNKEKNEYNKNKKELDKDKKELDKDKKELDKDKKELDKDKKEFNKEKEKLKLEKYNLAKELTNMNYSIEKITEITGLSEEEINSIK